MGYNLDGNEANFQRDMCERKKRFDINQRIFLEEKTAKINTVAEVSNESDLPLTGISEPCCLATGRASEEWSGGCAATQKKRGSIHNSMDVCTSV